MVGRRLADLFDRLVGEGGQEGQEALHIAEGAGQPQRHAHGAGCLAVVLLHKQPHLGKRHGPVAGEE